MIGTRERPRGGGAHEERGEPPAGWAPSPWILEGLTLAVVFFLVLRLLRRLGQLWRARTGAGDGRRAEDVEFEVLGSAAHVSEVIEADAAEQRAGLAEDGEPRNAIVECWHRFEQQAVRAGVDRRPWQTTAEFVLGVLDLVERRPRRGRAAGRPLPRGPLLRPPDDRRAPAGRAGGARRRSTAACGPSGRAMTGTRRWWWRVAGGLIAFAGIEGALLRHPR